MILLEFFEEEETTMTPEYRILDDQNTDLTEKMNRSATEGFRVIGYSPVFIDDGMSGAIRHYALLEKTED